MQVTVEHLSPVMVELKVTVPPDRVEQSVNNVYKDLARSVHIKGFRKGKAPRSVLAHLYSAQVAQEVAEKLRSDTFDAALQSNDVRPLSSPQFDLGKISPKEEFTYRARFEVAPAIEKVNYEGMKVTRHMHPVSDDEIETELSKLQEQHAILKEPEPLRPAKLGDVVSFDFELFVNDKSEGKDEMVVELGDHLIFKDIEDALVDKDVDAEFSVNVDFPANHPSKNLAGKQGTFNVKVKEIKEKILPELDDEFAKDVSSDLGTLDELKEDIRKRLQKSHEAHADNELAEELVAELCRLNQIPVPPSLVQQQAKLQEDQVLDRARHEGDKVNGLAPSLRKQIEADAEMKVRAGLLMAEIAKTQGIKVDQDDINKAYEELAEQTGQNVAKVRSEYRTQQQQEMLIGMILEDKVLDLLEKAAEIETIDAAEAHADEETKQQEEPEEEAPEKA